MKMNKQKLFCYEENDEYWHYNTSVCATGKDLNVFFTGCLSFFSYDTLFLNMNSYIIKKLKNNSFEHINIEYSLSSTNANSENTIATFLKNINKIIYKDIPINTTKVKIIWQYDKNQEDIVELVEVIHEIIGLDFDFINDSRRTIFLNKVKFFPELIIS